MAKLKLVSLTGADNEVNRNALYELSKRYPFVEWAFLYFPEKMGISRNPDQNWLQQFFAEKPDGLKTAVHLCGEQVFRDIMDSDKSQEVMAKLQHFDRIQININARRQTFTDIEVRQVYRTLLASGKTLILQYHEDSSERIQYFSDMLNENERRQLNILFDTSKGKGVRPEIWPTPIVDIFGNPIYGGYAGGLNPDNIEESLLKINKMLDEFSNSDLENHFSPIHYWMDMESGIRTDNRFDLDKVEAVLRQCEPYVE